jgi:hypothetical protein
VYHDVSKYKLQWDKLTPIGVKSDPDGTLVQIFSKYDEQRKYGRELIKWLANTHKDDLDEGPSAADDWSDDDN